MNKIYYFEVLVDNLSICIDSEVAYYHYFKKGDTFEYFYEDNYINIPMVMVKIGDHTIDLLLTGIKLIVGLLHH
jgi:hypothetical protein